MTRLGKGLQVVPPYCRSITDRVMSSYRKYVGWPASDLSLSMDTASRLRRRSACSNYDALLYSNCDDDSIRVFRTVFVCGLVIISVAVRLSTALRTWNSLSLSTHANILYRGVDRKAENLGEIVNEMRVRSFPFDLQSLKGGPDILSV